MKVKLISEICRNGAFLKDRAMFSYAGGGGGEGWRRREVCLIDAATSIVKLIFLHYGRPD